MREPAHPVPRTASTSAAHCTLPPSPRGPACAQLVVVVVVVGGGRLPPSVRGQASRALVRLGRGWRQIRPRAARGHRGHQACARVRALG